MKLIIENWKRFLSESKGLDTAILNKLFRLLTLGEFGQVEVLFDALKSAGPLFSQSEEGERFVRLIKNKTGLKIPGKPGGLSRKELNKSLQKIEKLSKASGHSPGLSAKRKQWAKRQRTLLRILDLIEDDLMVDRPAYQSPVDKITLLRRVEEFILETTPQPKGDSLAQKGRLEKGGHVCHPSFGLCFDAATLLQHMLGGKHHSGLAKTRAGKSPLGPSAPGEESTHWWLEDEEGAVLDPTAQQFTFGADPPYDKREKSDFGRPYFKQGGTKYSETVPSLKVLKFAEAFKEWHKQKYGEETAFGMDWWFKEKLK